MKVFMDTNTILYFLIDKTIKNVNVEFVISFITEIELLSYPFIKVGEEIKIKNFLKNIQIVNIINEKIKNITISFRKKYKLKLPDAIICATAYVFEMPLITNDKKLFKVLECEVMDYNKFKEKFTT